MPDAGACVSYSPVYGLSVPFSRRTRNCSADAYAVSFACCTELFHEAPRAEGRGEGRLGRGGRRGGIYMRMRKMFSQQKYTFGKNSSPLILTFLHGVRGGHVCFSCRARATEQRPEKGKSGHRSRRCLAD